MILQKIFQPIVFLVNKVVNWFLFVFLTRTELGRTTRIIQFDMKARRKIRQVRTCSFCKVTRMSHLG